MLLLLRRVRLVPVVPDGGTRRCRSARTGGPVGLGDGASGAPDGPVDLRLDGGVVTDVAPSLTPSPDDDVLDAEGRWALPGLWDQHVHLGQVARRYGQLDLSAARSAAAALAVLRDHLAAAPGSAAGPDRAAGPAAGDLVLAHGMRQAHWPDPPTASALEDVSAGRAVVVVSADVHCGWLSASARDLLGLPPAAGDDGLVRENEWFGALRRLGLLGTARAEDYRTAVADAAARGVVGVTDMEFAPNPFQWPDRLAAGVDRLRVRAAAYADDLADVLAAGLRTGDPLPGGRGLLTMGPLKIISDGSLNTATAHTMAPYPHPRDPAHPRGIQNVDPAVLRQVVARATRGGLAVAVHAIGDAAVGIALDAIEAAGGAGSVEHAQLLAPGQAERFAALGVVASVQPAHLLDDRDVTEESWPGGGGRSFVLRELLDAGARLALGSDAPVAPLDPWLAMGVAVHRSGDERGPWHPEQQITAAEALAASTDGQGTLAVGSRADVVLVDDDPLRPFTTTAETGAHLRGMRVAATVVAGRITHGGL